jgi:hypothetical protein
LACDGDGGARIRGTARTASRELPVARPRCDKVVLRSDVPNGVHPGQGVHVGANPAARAAANDRVRAFLHERLQQVDKSSYRSP